MTTVHQTKTDRLLLTAAFPNMTTDALFAHLTQPDLLIKWWPQEVPAFDATVGAVYHLAWPAMDWHLRGEILAVVPGKLITYTWKWDHTPDLPMREVTAIVQPDKIGAALLIIHSFYGESDAEQADRQSHREGWTHFLGQLAALSS